jgi:hypothetical protein
MVVLAIDALILRFLREAPLNPPKGWTSNIPFRTGGFSGADKIYKFKTIQ